MLCLALFSDYIPTSETSQENMFQGNTVVFLGNPAKYNYNSISVSTQFTGRKSGLGFRAGRSRELFSLGKQEFIRASLTH